MSQPSQKRNPASESYRQSTKIRLIGLGNGMKVDSVLPRLPRCRPLKLEHRCSSALRGRPWLCDKAGTTCRASQFNINRLRSSTNKTLPLCSTASGSIALQAVTYSGSATSKTYYADASPGVLECACCGKSNVNTSGSLPVFSISTPPLESAAWVMNPISG